MEEMGIIFLVDQASGLNALGAVEKALSRVGAMAESISRTLATSSIALMDAQRMIKSVASDMADIVFGVSAKGIKAAADVQESNDRLEFSLSKIGITASSVIDRIEDISLRTVLSRKDISDMVSDLAIQRINVFDESLDSLFVTMKDGSKQSVSSLEVLNDAVAFSGKNSKRIMLSVKEAVSEQNIKKGRLLADDLNLAGHELERWNKVLKGSKNSQEAFNNLMTLTAERVGGVTASLGNSLNFALKQVDDWRDKFASTLFEGTLKPLRDLLMEVGDVMLKLVASGKLIPIRDAITSTVEGLVVLAKVFLVVLTGFLDLVSKAPWIIQVFTAMTIFALAAAGAATAMAAIVGPTVAIVAMATALISLVQFIPLIAGGFFLLYAILSPIVMLLTAITALTATWIQSIVKADSFGQFWERIGLLISGVWEGVKNMREDTTKLPFEMAQALERAGLLDDVENITEAFYGLKVMAQTAFDSLQNNWPKIKEIFEPAYQAILRMAKVLGIDLSEGVDASMSVWEQRGVMLANTITALLTLMAKLVEKSAEFAEKYGFLFGFEPKNQQSILKEAGFSEEISDMRPEEIERIQRGEISVPLKYPGGFGKFFEFESGINVNVPAENLEQELDPTKSPLAFKVSDSGQARAREHLKLYRFLQANPNILNNAPKEYDELLGTGSDMTSVPLNMSPTAAISALPQMSQLRATNLMTGRGESGQLGLDDPKNYSELARLVGVAVAAELKKNPASIVIDADSYERARSENEVRMSEAAQ